MCMMEKMIQENIKKQPLAVLVVLFIQSGLGHQKLFQVLFMEFSIISIIEIMRYN